MEKWLKIEVDKSHYVYGRMQGALTRPLFIIVHGLPCSIYEGFYERATQWFAGQGFASYRFNLYDWHKDARQLIDCTLRTHADDIDAVVRYFRRKGAKKVYLAGHSFGGPSILLSTGQDFDACALWDPSYDISVTKKKYGYPGGKYVTELDGYFMNWGTNVVIGKNMAQEIDELPWNELTSQFHVPLKIIAAEKGVLVRGAKQYFAQANQPKQLQIMKGATHYFDDTPNMQERVFKASKQWFDKF